MCGGGVVARGFSRFGLVLYSINDIRLRLFGFLTEFESGTTITDLCSL